MSEDLVDGQLRYYRARAGEYDETSYGVGSGERSAVPGIVDRVGISGDVLELACGSGIWTTELARHAKTLTALDGAPEMIELARRRTPKTVHFRLANLFQWTPDAWYDVVFFAAWLSHVPDDRFDIFWGRLAAALRAGGRVVAVDELPGRSHLEDQVEGEVALRTLEDGSQHEIVKIFWEPEALSHRLDSLGWHAVVTPIEHDWFILQATR